MSEPLHTKYRPRDFNEVIGQDAAITALDRILGKGTSRAFLFIGPAGTGKTTLARIAAEMSGCVPGTISEIDAATNTGIDAMRAVQEVVRYKPMGAAARKSVIIDEAHRLSAQAWDSLLKVVEEPPKHAMWFFCSTDPRKIPTTIKTRCTALTLTLLDDEQIRGLVQEVAGLEKIKLDPGVMDLVVREARGSPRQALVNLATCDGCKNKRQAAELLQTALDSDATLELCRYLMQGGSWHKAMAILTKLEQDNPEGVRIVVCNYFASVLKSATNDKKACHALSILEAFATPYNQAEGMAPLYLSVGRVLYP
jgi:DNA polymerase III gamma/tau subunit